MNLDDSVRFVTIVNKSGIIEFGGQREGIKNYLSEEDQTKSIKHILDAWFTRNQFFESIGNGKYAMAEYDRVKRFTFPLNNNHFLYITTEPKIDSSSFINNVLNVKEEFEK